MAHNSKEHAALILEKAAEYIEALEQANAEHAARQSKLAARKQDKRASELNSAYLAATGKELPAEVLSKIAQDPAVTDAIKRLTAAEVPLDLGRAVTRQKRAGAVSDPEQALINFMTMTE